MSELLTANELAPLLKKHPKTIRQWKCAGKITAEIDTGHTLLFDADKVRQQLVKISRKPRRTPRRDGVVMIPTL